MEALFVIGGKGARLLVDVAEVFVVLCGVRGLLDVWRRGNKGGVPGWHIDV